MVKVRAFRTLENALRRHGVRPRRRRRRGRAAAAWPGPVVAAAVVLDPDRYIPRICDSKTVTALERERLYDQITRDGGRLGGASASIPTRSTHQHPSGVAARDAARGAAAWRRCPDFVLVDAFRIPDLPMAQRAVDPRRRPLHGDRGGLDRRQGHARPDDARAARAGSALRLRSAQGLRDARSPGRGRAVRLFRRASPLVPAALAV